MRLDELFGGDRFRVVLHEGVNTFVGPNGSGKSQVLRQLKEELNTQTDGDVLLLTAGRLQPLESGRQITRPGRGSPSYSDPNITLSEGYRERWNEVENAQGVINRIGERKDLQIKITERLSTLFGRDLRLTWERGNLQVRFIRGGDEYESTREASGLLHLVVILGALYDGDLDAVLVDEPDVSLHPQLQAYILDEMRLVAGDPNEGDKIVAIATHSSAMVQIRNAEDLARFAFFHSADTSPKQIEAGAEVLESRELSKLIRNLSVHHREALFAQRPLLVEGQSDEIVLKALDGALGHHLHAAGGYVLPVGGTGEMGAALKLLRQVGKEPMVLADLDAFTDDLRLVNLFNNVESGQVAAQESSHESVHDAAQTAHDRLTAMVQNHWDSIEAEATQHPYWGEDIAAEDTELIRKRRAAAATILTMNPESVEDLPYGDQWRAVRRLLQSALDLIEEAGCFFHRAGEIEDSYAAEGRPDDKLDGAQTERKEIQENPFQAEARHIVAIRALERVAQAPMVNESAPIVGAFTAAVTPAIAKLRQDEEASTQAIQSEARIHAEEATRLFELTRTDVEGEPAIKVELNSSILDVSGFPITVGADQDVATVAQRKISG